MAGTAEAAQAVNVAAVERFFESVSQRELDGVLSVYAEDCEFTAPKSLPWGGTYRGHEGIRQLFESFMPYWKENEEHAEAIVAGEHEVMVVVRQRGRTRTDAAYDELLALHFEMRDGKLFRGRGFVDTSTMLRAIGAQPRT
ncbi:MAG: nuclear transport factor 2 family protein [Conexibacter sp.]